MAKMRRMDSKAALSQQRANMRRGARGKMHVGDDTGGTRARAAERERVHQMQALQHERQAAHEREQFLAELRLERERAEARAAGERRVEHLHEPITALLGELITDGVRLARTFVLLPFRVAAALRHSRTITADA